MSSKMQHFQKNLVIFRDTFQKPSQIYKYLGEIWKTNPLYLNRTLSYISKHRNRTIRKRINKIDLLAADLLKKQSNNVKQVTRRNSQANHREKVCDINNDISLNNRKAKSICYYNWICNDSSRTSQKTKSCGFICAWCENDYHYLDSLMMHLKCCHSRFNFNLVEEEGQSVIEMTLNASFDGSYCGFKYPGHDLKRDFKFTPDLPERRMPTTQIIYFKVGRRRTCNIFNSKLKQSNYDMYIYDEGDVDVDVCSGRLYYHTSTCLPVKPNEVDLDSEADLDPDWLRERTQLMIEEFTDVNEGEKEILKLWNLHIMKNYKYKGDNMIRQACLDFVDLEGAKILSRNLCKNFTLHLANLFDFGLISSGDMLECVRKLQKLKPPVVNTNITGKISVKTRSERNNNEHCQHSPAKRAVLNSH